MRFTMRAIVVMLMGGCTSQAPEQKPEQSQSQSPSQARSPSQAPSPVQSACGGERPAPPVRIAQGIAGVVCFWDGDFMPGDSNGTIQPVARTIEVYAAITDKQAVRADERGFWASVATPLVTKAVSGDDGWFEVALAPGRYSLFVREAQGLFANRYDDAGVIVPVEVAAGAVTRTQLDVDYASVH